MNEFSLAQALFAGLFALLGAFAGAALSRRTEYEKWLRQEKSKAFGEFLKELHKTRLAGTEAYYGDDAADKDEHAKSIKTTEAFAQLQPTSGVARLYMTTEGRTELSKLLNQLWINCTVQGGPANRTAQIRVQMEQIQDLLERELTHLPREVRLSK